MSEWLVVSGIIVAAVSGLPGLLLSRSSMIGQWVTTVLAVLASGLGLAGVLWFWASGESQPIVLPWAIPGCTVQRGDRRSVGLLPCSDFSDLAPGKHLRTGLLEADRAPAERPEAAAFLRHVDRRHGTAGHRTRRHTFLVRLGDHGPLDLLSGHHGDPRERGPGSWLDLPRCDTHGNSLSLRGLRALPRRKRLVLTRAAQGRMP